MEEMTNNTGAFPELCMELIRNDYVPTRIIIGIVMIILTEFQKKMKQPEFQAGKLIEVQTLVHPFLLDNKTAMNTL